MYGLFHKEVLELIRLANSEAERLNHEYVGTEHLLYAILKRNRCNAHKTLKQLTSIDSIRFDLDKIVIIGPTTSAGGTRPHTLRTKKVFELAEQWGTKRSKTLQIDTDDLLLGLIEENDGVAAQVLMNKGLSIETVRSILNFQEDSPKQEEDTDLQMELEALKVNLGATDISDTEALRRANQIVLAAKGIKLVMDETIGEQPEELMDQTSDNCI